MELDPLLLSRLQFAFVVSFHAIFPVFTIGLASYITVLHALFYKTQNPAWDRLAYLWTKVFAVAFGMGVVSGIVMSFQFGTNWSNFSQASANFIGPLLSYEVVTAFFLEAAFLGVLLFGRGRVPQGVHLFAASMVALGTFISTFWILAANSWMHTPAGSTSSMAASASPRGWKRSSTRRSPTASRTWQWRRSSPAASWWRASAPGT